MIDIIPGINERDVDEIKHKLKKIAPFSNRVHIDIEDSEFVKRTTVLDFSWLGKFNNELSALRSPPHDLEFEWHLMAKRPEDYLYSYNIGSKKRAIAHIEAMDNIDEFLSIGSKLGYKLGLALNLETPISNLKNKISNFDFIQLMSVKLGLSGQKFNPKALDKIKELMEYLSALCSPITAIQIDGGINPETAKLCIDAGAASLVSTSYVSGAEDVKKAIDLLKGFTKS